MKQKPITGDPTIGKKHVIVLTLLNLVTVLLYLGFWMMVIYIDFFPDLLTSLSYFSVTYGLVGLFFTVLGYILVLLRINFARVIMETIYLCVGIGVMIFYVLAPIMIPFLAFSLLCLFDFAVLFFDKHIYAYCHSREKQDTDAETGKPKPLI